MALAALWNRALSAIGAEDSVSDPTENSREAATCRKWYPFVRDMIQGAAPWPSVTDYARLALVGTADDQWSSGDPTPGFIYRFAAPAGLLRPYYLNSFARFAYTRGHISCNEPAPILYYLRREEDLQMWDLDLEIAVTHMLAAYLAKPLAGKSQIMQEQFELAQFKVEEARAAAANVEMRAVEDLPDWLQVRGYGNSPVDKYFYPLGALNVERAE